MRRHLFCLTVCIACAAGFQSQFLSSPVVFRYTVSNIFVQETMTLAADYRFVIRGHDCCGSYSGSGRLTAEEAENFDRQLQRRFRQRKSRLIGESEGFEEFETKTIHWKGSCEAFDRVWLSTTWCEREKQKLRQQKDLSARKLGDFQAK